MKRREEKQKLSDIQRAELKAVIDSLFEDDPDSPYERKRIRHYSDQATGLLAALKSRDQFRDSGMYQAALAQQQNAMYQLMAQADASYAQMAAKQQEAALRQYKNGSLMGASGMLGALGVGGLF